jgi:two-component system sensor histidine kinase/response regulator
LNKCAQSCGDFTLQTDPDFLKIVLRNLVANAIKFSPVQSTIELIGARQSNATTITVRDNGKGIGTADLTPSEN